MPAGRPSKYDPANVVDFPEVKRSASGNVYIARRLKRGSEAQWCMKLANHVDDWRGLVDLPAVTQIDVEVAIGPERKTMQGLCRADMIIWHGPKCCSIVEAKTDCSPNAIAAGLGQLLYYRALVSAYWEVEVEALVLAAPELPPFLLEAIAVATAPIRFLKCGDDGNFSGLVPRYSGLA
jgi:hypothetical protein